MEQLSWFAFDTIACARNETFWIKESEEANGGHQHALY
jgi:hypothetical protein